MIAAARLAAYEVLRDVETRRSDLPAALARVRARLTDERDRALAGEIATGTVRWQAAFDHVISALSRRPAGRLDAEVRLILRLTVFQLLHLDRIPASAAVNDAVQLTRKAGKTSASGLVNAVLRRVSRERGKLPLPPRPDDPEARREESLAYLSTTLSHPSWLMGRWMDAHGFDNAAEWAQFNNTPAHLTLRANQLRVDRETLAAELRRHGVETTPAPYAPDGLLVTNGNPLLTPLASQGLFLVQDEASQLVGVFTAIKAGELVLDACASPGGKATQMAAAGARRVVASDVRPRRVGLLRTTVREVGADTVTIVQADARRLPARGAFDCVLLDAPCSGLGTLRRDPDIKWHRTAEELPALAAAQAVMLEQAAAAVRVGGRVVYSTCSSEPEENEEVVERFLASHPEFSVMPPDALPEPVRPLTGTNGYFRTLPFRHRLEAFFAAMLVKTKDLR